MSNEGRVFGFVVKLDDKDFLTGFDGDNMWPTSSQYITEAEMYKKYRTAEYAKELCIEKLNDDYDPEVKEILIEIDD